MTNQSRILEPGGRGPQAGRRKVTPTLGTGKVLASIAELARELAPGHGLLGLDVGSKTIGLAVSDVTRMVATPLTTIRRKRFRDDAAELARVAADRAVAGFIVGLPVNMNGSEGPRCQSVRQFAANLADAIDLPIAFWDERLSTAAVERMMIEADLSRKRRGELNDKLAAAYILQGALDAMGRA
ncbi:MAG: Holliday junction resolvase RuvX [Alphaproteobacteria bacterium]|nr:Holliday junction resolvase RuvX [Alphaproteobacteria bacterium]